jgi:hypothetical protein
VDSHDADADLRASINLPSRAPVSPGRNLPYLSKSPRISRTSSTRRAAVSRETEATAPRPRPRPRGAALSTTHSTAAPVLAELSPASPDSEPPISSRPRSVHDADVVARWLRPYLWSRPPMQVTAHDGQHGSDTEYTADDIVEHARERRPKDRCKACEMHRTRGAQLEQRGVWTHAVTCGATCAARGRSHPRRVLRLSTAVPTQTAAKTYWQHRRVAKLQSPDAPLSYRPYVASALMFVATHLPIHGVHTPIKKPQCRRVPLSGQGGASIFTASARALRVFMRWAVSVSAGAQAAAPQPRLFAVVAQWH